MLPGPILRRTLAGLHSQPLRVVPVQRAGKLPVWLLRGPVAHQYGEAQRGTPAAQFPLRLQYHVCVHQLRAGHLRVSGPLQATSAEAGGGSEVCGDLRFKLASCRCANV